MSKIFDQETKWNLYHYTDLNALINILSKDRIILRATNILYLNDPHELIEGIKVVDGIQETPIQPGAFRNYYITSFSACKDNLSMWGMYAANGNGCALGFDYDELAKGYEFMIKCIYGKDNIEQHFHNIHGLAQTGCFTTFVGPKLSEDNVARARKTLTDNNVICTCLGAKNEAYHYESETRGIIYCNDSKRILFRTRNGYIVPYIEVSLLKSALKEIVIGPTNNTDLKEQSIIHFLQINGYSLDDIKLIKSNIPYRG